MSIDKIPAVNELKPQNSPLENNDRLTVNLAMHHEQLGEQPYSVQCLFSQLLEGQEQVYRRRRMYKKQEQVDTGFVDPNNVGMVLIENRIKQRTVNPTQAEVEKDKALDVLVCVGEESFLIRPGRFMLFEPIDIRHVFIKPVLDHAHVTTHIFPR